MIKSFEEFVNENLHNNSDINTEYISYVVIDNSDGALLSNYDKDSLEDAIEEVKELAKNNKYGTYYVCGVDKNDTYSYDIEDENNTIVYNSDEL
jgi:hypothetical protein